MTVTVGSMPSPAEVSASATSTSNPTQPPSIPTAVHGLRDDNWNSPEDRDIIMAPPNATISANGTSGPNNNGSSGHLGSPRASTPHLPLSAHSTHDDRVRDRPGSVHDHDLSPAKNSRSQDFGDDRDRASSVGDRRNNDVPPSSASAYREGSSKHIGKPNKVYIGGLPDHTHYDDLKRCFGQIGTITNIELKSGFGFVEFDSAEAAEESVAKYHEGQFMGNTIRVEISRGGTRVPKHTGEPGACFKCGELGHWARECPTGPTPPPRSGSNHHPYEPDVIRRHQPPPAPAPPPPRSYAPPSRDDYGPARYPPRDSRDARYDYLPTRDYRRPPTPPYREYPPVPALPPPPPRGRDYDDYGRRGPPDRDRHVPPPPPDYRGRYAPPLDTGYRGPPGPPAPPPMQASYYDRYDRRPADRYSQTYPPPPPRGRTPPPIRERDDYDRPPVRYDDKKDMYYPPPRDHRDYDYRRPPSPPPPGRYQDPPRYRRRSESPPAVRTVYDTGYPPPRGSGYSGNYVPPPPGPPPRRDPRDYPPPRRETPPNNAGYRRL